MVVALLDMPLRRVARIETIGKTLLYKDPTLAKGGGW